METDDLCRVEFRGYHFTAVCNLTLVFFCGVDLSAVKEIDERKLKKSVSVIVLAVEERGQTKSCL